MKKVVEIIAAIRAVKDELRDVYHLENIELFGSFSRGDFSLASDVDLLVDFTGEADIFNLIGAEQFLEKELGLAVDIVPRRALRKEFRQEVFKEAIAV